MSSQPETATAGAKPTEPKKPTTAEQLLRLPDDGKRYELIAGGLRMMSPAGSRHGRVAMRVGSMLEQHARAHELGAIYAAETGFILSRDPDTVRAPDVAFVSKNRLAQVEETDGYLELAPDLAVEVISPSDSFTYIEEKALAWLKAGARMVLVVNPATRSVHLYRGSGDVQLLRENDTLDADEVVAGWRVPVHELFE